MKVETTYRYVGWHENGKAFSCSTLSVSRGDVYWKKRNPRDELRSTRQNHLDGMCPGEWYERLYDTEDETDQKLIQAMMNL